MNRRALIVPLLIALPGIPTTLQAQTLSAAKVFGKTDRTRSMSVEHVTPDRDVLIFLPTVPLTFNSLQKDSEGEWRFGPAITMGAGFTFILGKARLNGPALAEIVPWLTVGAGLNWGIRESLDDTVEDVVSGSLFIGTSEVAISFSRPLIDGAGTSIGLSLKIDAITDLAPDAFMCLKGCNPGG